MKIRSDFVTNSSSSSYVCDICGAVYTSYDEDDIYNYDIHTCENGHTFCVDEMDKDITWEDKLEYAKKLVRKNESYYVRCDSRSKEEILQILDSIKDEKQFEDSKIVENILDSEESIYLNVPENRCPICTHEYILDKEIINFAAEKLGIDETELKQMTREFLIEKDKKQAK